MRIQSMLLVSTIGLFSLVGCGQTSTTPTASEPSPVSSAPANSTLSAQSSYPELLSVVEKTQAAVKGNDFAKAQQEFDQFEAAWSPVEDGIKEKSSESYDAIEQDMDKVTATLRASNSAEATAALQTMHEHIQSIP